MLILNTANDDSTQWIEPITGLRLKVASADSHQYRSRFALVSRHINKLEESLQLGTKDFTLGDGELDSVDDLLLETVAKFILTDWEGVGEEINGEQQAIDYSPQKGVALLRQYPELYWQVLGTAAELANAKQERLLETVTKH